MITWYISWGIIGGGSLVWNNMWNINNLSGFYDGVPTDNTVHNDDWLMPLLEVFFLPFCTHFSPRSRGSSYLRA
jgi:hypothetical protein